MSHWRDLLWTLRYGDRSALPWLKQLRIVLLGLLLAFEAVWTNFAWDMAHVPSDVALAAFWGFVIAFYSTVFPYIVLHALPWLR